MILSESEVLQFAAEEDVRFIKLAFCDCKGNQKNISMPASELKNAFEKGVCFDAYAIYGCKGGANKDLVLKPLPETFSILPWRSADGRVARMFCNVYNMDGSLFTDGRAILTDAVNRLSELGINCEIGAKFEFYLFVNDEKGNETTTPYDQAGYMDVAPYDKGENVRRDMCLTLEEMGVHPVRSHHEAGPGQNQIDFKPNKALAAADDALTFKNVIKSIAARYGLTACFNPKPLSGMPGSGLHIELNLSSAEKKHIDFSSFTAGILEHIRDITIFLNPISQSYERLGEMKAPKYVSWSNENHAQLIRVTSKDHSHIELRSPDCKINPYIAYALLIYAGIDGVKRKLNLPAAVDVDFCEPAKKVSGKLAALPADLPSATAAAGSSGFVKKHVPAHILKMYGIE